MRRGRGMRSRPHVQLGLGSTLPMARDSYLVIVPAGAPIRFLSLGEREVRIGSSPDAEVHLPDPELAAVHARIEPREGGYVLVREALPLLVNGLRARAQILKPQDLIVLGRNAIAFRSGVVPELAASPAASLDPIRRLHAFAECVREHADPESLGEQLVADLLELTNASRGTLVRFTQDEDPERIATCTRGSFSGGEIAYSSTLLARMRDGGRAVFVENTLLDPSMADAESLLGGPPQAAMAVPIVHEGRVLGALYASSRVGSLTPAHLELLDVYATLAVGLLESERKASTLQAQLTELGGSDTNGESLLVGSSAVMQALRRSLRKVAASKAPVLLRGETGTGKDLVAREIHRLSPRARGPFVAVNCGAIPPELLTSELFGHVKGAFTQAHRDRLGLFRSADTGTLFLDEIGEMPLAQQVALLRVLQDGCVTPVGAETPVPVDVRMLCATNLELEAEVARARFRQDLYYRIAVVTVTVPPLRDRQGDVVLLAQHFLRKHAREQRGAELRFSDEAIRGLKLAQWEGNVRELEAAVRRAVVMCESTTISARDLGLQESAAAAEPEAIRPLAMARDEYLRDYVRKVVDRLGGNRTAAAEALIVTPRTVFKYLEE